VLKVPAPHHDGTFLHFDRTLPPTLRTRLLRPQQPALLAGGVFEGSRRQPTGGGHGDFLHLAQIDIQPWPLVAEGMPYDNFSPALGEFRDLFQIFGGQLP
jgi:hypothetical protein